MCRFLYILFLIPYVFALPALAEECDKARSSADVMKCLTKVNQRVETELNRVFDALSIQSEADALTRIKETQAQWLDYRNSNCDQETAKFDAESLKRIEGLRCRNRLTRERITAIENATEESVQDRIVGEAPGQSRWMNALAEDYPDVFWHYGARIEGDTDCDGDMEHVMSGLRVDAQSGELLPVISVSENPATGRPHSVVVIVPLAEGQEDEEPLMECGLVSEISFTAVPKAPVDDEAPADEAGDDTQCANFVTVHPAHCRARKLYASENGYEFRN